MGLTGSRLHSKVLGRAGPNQVSGLAPFHMLRPVSLSPLQPQKNLLEAQQASQQLNFPSGKIEQGLGPVL